MNRTEELIRNYLDEVASDEEVADLDRLLTASPDVAEAFARASRRDHAFYSHFAEEEATVRTATLPSPHVSRSRPVRRLALAAAACLAVVLGGLFLLPGPTPLGVFRTAGPGTTIARDGSVVPAKAGAPVYIGDRLSGSGSIEIDVSHGGVHLELAGDVALDASTLTLHRGRLELDVPSREGRDPLRITTPHAEAVILGTRLSLTADPDETWLEVTEGRVRLERKGESVDVAAGHFAVVAESGGATLEAAPLRGIHEERFLRLWRELHDPENGYFSPDGHPYHSVETLIVDAPDYGHLTTSETYSYWIWLEAAYGRLTGDWSYLTRAWKKMEEALIPSRADQPTNEFYDPGRPAAYVPEMDSPEAYPVSIDASVVPGADPLAAELAATYGTRDLYAMHWLADLDNWYGFGRRGDGKSTPSLLNTFSRGPRESVWETVPHPSWEAFTSGGEHGFLDLFVEGNTYAKQWRYTCAPDADARAVQAMYWAAQWAREQGKDPAAVLPLDPAARMGDTLRYAHHDKYFKGDDPHYLLAWSFGWGGSIAAESGWAWRSGASHAHFGYQNPFAAWVLSSAEELRPRSPHAVRDWRRSLDRQIEFYRWLQSSEGAIAGGATRSWKGRYETPPAGTSTFYDLAFDAHPVFLDPPSNEWFGWQAWSMERLAQYASASKDARATAIIDKWATWARSVVQLRDDGTYAIPATLRWTGQPDAWNPAAPGANASLHVSVQDTTQDVGVTGSLARALLYHGSAESRTLAAKLLERMWALYRDDKGIANPESRADYVRFNDSTPFPEPWRGRTPHGHPLQPGATFLDVRRQYRDDPAFPRLEKDLRAGRTPVFRYHRFWAQVEIALAYAEFARTQP